MPQINIKVKAANEAAFPLTVDTTSTVLVLKETIHREGPGDVHPENQRLIFAGKVLRNDQTLDVLKDGCTVHMVKGQSRPADASASSDTAAPRTATAQNTGSGATPASAPANAPTDANPNPYASMGNPFGAGLPPQLAGLLNPQLLSAVYSNPEVARVLADPSQIQAMMSSPLAGAVMSTMMRAMAQGATSQPPATSGDASAAADPSAMLRALLGQSQGGADAMRGADGAAGAAGGLDFNAMLRAMMTPQQQPQTSSHAADGTTTDADTAAAAAVAPASAFGAQMLQAMLSGLGPQLATAGQGAQAGDGAVPLQADTRPVEVRYETQLRQLSEMGFTDPTQNVRALTLTGGNVDAAIEFLLRNR